MKCCPRLTTFDLKGCEMVTLDCIETLCNGTSDETNSSYSQSRLTDLNLEIEFLSKAALSLVAASCPRLTALSIANCRNFCDDDLIVKLAEGCPLLKSLNLNGCSDLKDRSILSVAKHCTSLEQLHLSQSFYVTNEAMVAIAASCPRLTVLNTSSCDKITGPGIVSIAVGCPQLRTLRLSGSQMSDPALEALAAHCPHLQQLNLSIFYKDPSEDLLVALVVACRDLRVLSFGMGHRQLDGALRERLQRANSKLMICGGDRPDLKWFTSN
eukprot:gene25188-31618_t